MVLYKGQNHAAAQAVGSEAWKEGSSDFGGGPAPGNILVSPDGVTQRRGWMASPLGSSEVDF